MDIFVDGEEHASLTKMEWSVPDDSDVALM